ncbi:MMPL family transporter [Cohnella zeiphila]|uniref:MMPL family transporter n=1 Tax=Cohnella zeiphila TaxID=2761120 RepID=A0A7X0SNH5_9BACL|nr:MMPL family transporter [Cohnella zeiphila]MBB6733091.1 MMPL family transporter [Cohnella zeiphila]
MKTILRMRWLVLALWLAAVAALALTAPNMADLVREKGQITVPNGYSSSNANEWLNEMSAQDDSGSKGQSTALVFHSDRKLTQDQLDEIKQGIESLKAQGSQLGVTGVTSSFDNPELADQMVSKDGKTVLALVNVDLEGREASAVSDSLYDALSTVKVEHYFTGGWMIEEDVVQSSESGLKKTELITVGFILIILFVVFRSAIAPFIPLFAVGISYVAAQSVVSYLVRYLDFPLSNFTQIFMVAIMFGIGTDYCILLISRFKEELAHNGGDKTQAILTTYRTAGRTVLVSGLAVLVGFSAIGFSTFGLYRSAVAVAVGVAVLLIALVTLVPFFMATLGKAIFWPSRGALEHKPNAMWGALGSFSLKRPLWALVVLAVILVPFLSMYKGTISFDSLDEIGSKYNSVKAFNVIADSFGPGEALPTTVVLKSDKPLDSSEGLAAIEEATRELGKVDGVEAVRSATRPTGEALGDFQVSNQASALDDGLTQGANGIGQVAQGLSDAGKQLEGNASKLSGAASGARQLANGTEDLKKGIDQLGDGLKRIEQGLRDGSAGAGQLKQGLRDAKASADKLAAAGKELSANYAKLESGLGTLSKSYGDLAASQKSLVSGLADLGQGLGSLADQHPELQQDDGFKQAQSALSQLQTNASGIQSGLERLNGQLAGVTAGLTQANGALSQAAAGQAKLAAGLQTLADGIASLQSGIDQAAAGQGQIIAQIPGVSGGADKIASGQKELADGFIQLNSQLDQLTSGLNQSVDGLNQVTSGLSSAQGYLGQLSSGSNGELGGWLVPNEALQNADFQTALDTYLSKDRKLAKIDVVFSQNPYASETLDHVDELKAAVDRALKGSAFSQTQVSIGGVSSMNNDLRHISSGDYSRTVILMLIGIALILIALFRSIVIPLYIILSLIGTYYTSMAMTELIFVRILGHAGVTWTTPFFGFVLLLALGVDYSIFLMDRFRENRHLPPQEAILQAMKSMGSVILSAAVILGGTFAAMLPSGVMTLLQVATVVLCGLFLYAVVILPLFIPVMVRTFGEANGWPFMNRQGRDSSDGFAPPVPSARSDAGRING